VTTKETTMSTPKKYYAARDFKDAGTEKTFSVGDDVTSEPGIDNYRAAGLASDKKPALPKDTDA
jgi:hypothetical protein